MKDVLKKLDKCSSLSAEEGRPILIDVYKHQIPLAVHNLGVFIYGPLHRFMDQFLQLHNVGRETCQLILEVVNSIFYHSRKASPLIGSCRLPSSTLNGLGCLVQMPIHQFGLGFRIIVEPTELLDKECPTRGRTVAALRRLSNSRILGIGEAYTVLVNSKLLVITLHTDLQDQNGTCSALSFKIVITGHDTRQQTFFIAANYNWVEF